MTTKNEGPVVATLAAAFWSLQNAATQMTVASVLAGRETSLRREVSVLADALELETKTLAAILDRLTGNDLD